MHAAVTQDADLRTREGLLNLFRERSALLEGHFVLSSGLHSPRYLQCARVLMDPPLATRLGTELGERLRPLLVADPPGAGHRPVSHHSRIFPD